MAKRKVERRLMSRREVLELAERMQEGRASPSEVKSLGGALVYLVAQCDRLEPLGERGPARDRLREDLDRLEETVEEILSSRLLGKIEALTSAHATTAAELGQVVDRLEALEEYLEEIDEELDELDEELDHLPV